MSKYIAVDEAKELIDRYDAKVEGDTAHTVVLAVRDIVSHICHQIEIDDAKD